MFSRFMFWPWFAGLVVLIGGLFAARRGLAAARGLDKLIVLGPVLVAAPLATFGAEHLVAASFVMQMVPAWIPGRLFWAYFVGFALLGAALSLVLRAYVRWSALLLGTMIFLFVVLIHIPNAASNPQNRILWTVALRDLAFAAGAWALAGSEMQGWRDSWSRRLITCGRFCTAIALIFFGVEHFIHPEGAPGVPLAKLTPAWVPLPFFWAYVTGAILLVAGVALLVGKRAVRAATSVGAVMTLLALVLYIPILATAKPAEMNEALNYVADTLMFGGTALLVAGALKQLDAFAKRRPVES